MISKEIIHYSLKNLWSRKTRSFLTILSIFIGIVTIFIFVSFGWGLYDYIEEFTGSGTADKIIIQAKGIGAPGLDDTFEFSSSNLKAVRKTTGVYEAEGVSFEPAKIEQDDQIKYVFLSGYDPKNPLITEMFGVDIERGKELKPGDSGKAVLGYNFLLKNKIFSKTYEINSKIIVQGVELRVIGFYQSIGNPQDDSNIYVTQDFKRELYGEEDDQYNMIIARVDTENIDAIVKRVESNLRKSRDLEKGEEDFTVQSFKDLIETYSTVLNAVIGFIVLIALISVLVAAINTANTMITSVLERTKEIGVIKSIGAKNSEIFKLFLFESSFLGMIAGIGGVLIGWFLTDLGARILSNLGWGFLSLHYSIILFGGCILFAVLAGAVSGVAPAVNASKTNPVDALRYE